jgi:hypothetical protein
MYSDHVYCHELGALLTNILMVGTLLIARCVFFISKLRKLPIASDVLSNDSFCLVCVSATTRKLHALGAYYRQNLAFAIKTKMGTLPTFGGQKTNEKT